MLLDDRVVPGSHIDDLFQSTLLYPVHASLNRCYGRAFKLLQS